VRLRVSKATPFACRPATTGLAVRCPGPSRDPNYLAYFNETAGDHPNTCSSIRISTGPGPVRLAGGCGTGIANGVAFDTLNLTSNT